MTEYYSVNYSENSRTMIEFDLHEFEPGPMEGKKVGGQEEDQQTLVTENM